MKNHCEYCGKHFVECLTNIEVSTYSDKGVHDFFVNSIEEGIQKAKQIDSSVDFARFYIGCDKENLIYTHSF